MKRSESSPTCHPERSEGSQTSGIRHGTIMNEKSYYVYILTNDWGNVMYVGMTSNIERRLYEHKQELADGFTKRYHVHKLVYYEQTNDAYAAVTRERQLKGWTRKRKNELVETVNPNWEDLSTSRA